MERGHVPQVQIVEGNVFNVNVTITASDIVGIPLKLISYFVYYLMTTLREALSENMLHAITEESYHSAFRIIT